MMSASAHGSLLIKFFAVLLLVSAVYLYSTSRVSAPTTTGESGVVSDYKNATYVIDGKKVTLVAGKAGTDIDPGSASKLVTQFFGNEAVGDVNGDGMPDVAFILTQYGGGTGTFYYVVLALKVEGGYRGTNAVFLGDRIAPQMTEITNGQIVANYVGRRPGDPMAAQPSVGVSKYLRFESGGLIAGDR